MGGMGGGGGERVREGVLGVCGGFVVAAVGVPRSSAYDFLGGFTLDEEDTKFLRSPISGTHD